MEKLAIKVKPRGDACVITLEGSLDIETTESLKKACASLSAAETPHIIVDLSHVQYIDSPGVGAILMECRRVRVHQGTFALVLPPPEIRRALSSRGVDRLLPSYPSVETALRSAPHAPPG